MKKIALLFAVIILSMNGFGQAPVIVWQKSLGGSVGDYGWSIHQKPDGSYITFGYSSSNDGDVTGNHGARDYWLVKLDGNGNMQWQRTFGGTDQDSGLDLQLTSDGGYIMVGAGTSFDGDVTGHHGNSINWNADYWVVKLDSNGILQWQKSLGGYKHDEPYSIQQTTDGGYIVAGHSNSVDGDVTGHHGAVDVADYWIVKLDAGGNLQWQKSLGGTAYDYATSIQQTTEGGYIIGGQSTSNDGDVTGNHGSADFWIVKIDSNGIIQWQKSLGGTDGEIAESIEQTADGGYIVAGNSRSNDGDVTGHHGTSAFDDCWIVKLDSNGTIQWQKSLGGNNYDEAYSIHETTDGGYILGAFSMSNDGDVTMNHGMSDYWIVKLDGSGNIQWQKSLGGTQSDFAVSVQQTSVVNYIVAGNSASSDGDATLNHGDRDFWIVKLGPFCNNFSINTSVLYSPLCYGGIGGASVTPLNGTPPYSYSWSSGDTTANVTLQAGTYSITITDSNLCSATATVVITQPPQLIANLSATPTDSSCIGSATAAASGGTPPFNYIWSTSAFTSAINNLCTGWYTVTVTDVNDCVTIDSVFVSLNTGIAEVPANMFTMSPNPTTSEVILTFNKATRCNVQLTNTLGEVLEQTQINSSSHKLDMSNKPKGIYFITVTDEAGNKVVRKVVKM